MSDLDHIEVRGARENNLRDVSVDIPKRAITVFTGVSGSGKSSLVFGTIAAESQRLINETYTAFIQSFMPNVGRPDVDTLRNLSAAILVDQERMGANSRSTVGTATDAFSMLRLVFSRLGEPHVGHSSLFSFNDPQGMCPECEGMGRVSTVDVDAMVDQSQSLNEGAITLPDFGVDSWQWRMFAESGYFDRDKKLADYSDAEWEQFLRGPEEQGRDPRPQPQVRGAVHKFERTFLSKDVETAQPHMRAAIERVATFEPCPVCHGARLNQAALGAKIDGRNIAECAAMQVDDLAQFLAGIDAPSVAPALEALRHTLDSLVEVGLGYLSLDRESATLSGGEAQRVKMVRHLGSSLSDVTYVFDEPTIGLHPHDVQRVNRLLVALRDKGNTVLVVEHEPHVIAIADRVVDMGPGAGVHGGTVVFEGDVAGPARVRHDHRPPLRDRAHAQGDGPRAGRRAARRERDAAQPARRDRRRPARRADRGHRRRRLRQELAHPRLPRRAARGGDRARPDGDPRLAALEPRHLHRPARPDPQGVRQGQRRQAGAVQRQLGRRLPGVQGQRRDLHRPRVHDRRGEHLRGVRGQALHGRGARVPAARREHRRRARDVGRGGGGLLRREGDRADAGRARRRRARATCGSASR